MNEQTDKIPAPVSLDSDGVAIHLSYIRRDVDQIKSIQEKSNAEIKAAIEKLESVYVTRSEHSEVLVVQKDHELRLRRLELWGALGVGGIYVINIIIGFYIAFKK